MQMVYWEVPWQRHLEETRGKCRLDKGRSWALIQSQGMVWSLLWRSRYLRLPCRIVLKCNTTSVSQWILWLWATGDPHPVRAFNHAAPRDMDKELGKGPLTSKAMKRRKKWEHREGKRKRWEETAGPGTFISACWSLTICVNKSCLFGVFGMQLFHVPVLTYSQFWDAQEPVNISLMTIVWSFPSSPVISWPSTIHKGKGHRKSPVAFEIHPH